MKTKDEKEFFVMVDFRAKSVFKTKAKSADEAVTKVLELATDEQFGKGIVWIDQAEGYCLKDSNSEKYKERIEIPSC